MFPFPLAVEFPSGDILQPVKAVETASGEAAVFEWSDATQSPVEIVSGAYEKIGRDVWRVDGIDGAYLLSRGRGCGCSHPLKRAAVTPRPAVAYA